MNNIDSIVIHCSATQEGRNIKAADIDKMHRERGFRKIGYHYVIDIDGTVEKGRNEWEEGAHCSDKGFSALSYNKHSIGICYIGGLDLCGNAKDTRTEAQKASMRKLVDSLCLKYPIKEIIGHRDASPDKNNDGIVESYEWVKQCPCFDVKSEFSKIK